MVFRLTGLVVTYSNNSSPSVVIDEGVNNSFSGIVAVMLDVRQIDGVVMLVVVLKNENTDPDGPDNPDGPDDPRGNAAGAAAASAGAVDGKGGTVAEFAPLNVSNPGKEGRLFARVVATPLAPKYGSGGAAAPLAGAVAASAGAAAATAAAWKAVMPPTFFFFVRGGMMVVCGDFVWCRQLTSEKTDVGALSVSDRHAMSARNWRHMHMSPTYVGDMWS